MTFSEIVFADIGDIVIKKASDNSIVETINATSDQITGDGTSTITIDPSVTLDPSTAYYIRMGSIAFKDEAGNSFAGITTNSTWNFTTAAGGGGGD